MKTRSPEAILSSTTPGTQASAECPSFFPHSTLAHAADVCTLVLFGAIASKFIGRFVARPKDGRQRKWTSLALVGMALGWPLMALFSLGLIRPTESGTYRWIGSVIFGAVLWTTWRAERVDPDGPRR